MGKKKRQQVSILKGLVSVGLFGSLFAFSLNTRIDFSPNVDIVLNIEGIHYYDGPTIVVPSKSVVSGTVVRYSSTS